MIIKTKTPAEASAFKDTNHTVPAVSGDVNPVLHDIVNHRLSGVKRSGRGWAALCPAHDDHNPSLSVTPSEDGKQIWIHCHAGCTPEAVIQAMDLEWTDLFADGGKRSKAARPQIVATYDYTDEDGKLLFQVVRKDSKEFPQRHPDPNGKGGWIWNMNGVRRVPYHLAAVKEAVQAGRPVYLCEGEKDADRLAEHFGYTATTAPQGAGKWKPEYKYRDHFHRAIVYLLPDNDDEGRRHARTAAEDLVKVAKEVRIVQLPNLPNKGDVTDWIDAGGTADELDVLVEAAPVIQAEAVTVVEDTPKEAPPWRSVTDQDVRQAIEGTALVPVVQALEAVTVPPLPLAVTLPRAIVLAGCALTEPKDDYNAENDLDNRRGIELCRLSINTAGGQVCNAWSLLVGESGSGKDIGNHDRLAWKHDWSVGTSGSAEGLADAYMQKGNGLLSISELSPWLDPKHWQGKSTSWLTAAFNKGWFNVNLSAKSGTSRKSRFCYPNVMANIQPDVLAKKATMINLADGYLPRFLITRIGASNWRPAATMSQDLDVKASSALEKYRNKRGQVDVPQGYLQNVFDEFSNHQAAVQPHWTRLVNEYGPRLAVMLSVANASGDWTVTITDDHWQRSAVLVRWFYKHAETVLRTITDDRQEAHMQRIYEFIVNRGKASFREISRYRGKGSVASDRQVWLAELEERGLVIYDKDANAYRPGKRT